MFPDNLDAVHRCAIREIDIVRSEIRAAESGCGRVGDACACKDTCFTRGDSKDNCVRVMLSYKAKRVEGSQKSASLESFSTMSVSAERTGSLSGLIDEG